MTVAKADPYIRHPIAFGCLEFGDQSKASDKNNKGKIQQEEPEPALDDLKLG